MSRKKSKDNQNPLKAKRFTALPTQNINKKELIEEVFRFTYHLKNSFSIDIYHLRHLLATKEGVKYLKDQRYKEFSSNPYLRKGETQKNYIAIVDFYLNSLDRLIKNNPFQLQKKITYTKYKRNVTDKKTKEIIHYKGDYKTKEMSYKMTSFVRLIRWLSYIDESNFDTAIKMIPTKTTPKQKDIDNVNKFNEELKNLRAKPYWNRIKALILSKRERLINKLKLVELTTGSFIRIGLDNKTPCSHIFEDETNSKYKTWYRFYLKDLDDIYIPMAKNSSFHNEDFRFLAKMHYVSLTDKGRLNVSVTYEYERPYKDLETLNSENLVGIDLNIASNLCAVSYHDREELIDYDREVIKEVVNTLKKLEEKGYKNHEIQEDKQLKKLFRRIEFDMKATISKVIQSFKEQGITDIVMEDLNLTNCRASLIKDKDLGIKYSKLIRLLRLSSIKEWFKEQANNRGLRVHLTTPSYTSQQCSCCGAIIKTSRNKRDYSCKTCGFKIDSDCNAARNIRFRLLLPDVLVKKLHSFEEGQLIPKKVKRETVKKLLTSEIDVDNIRQHPYDGFKSSKGKTATIITFQ